MRKLLLISVVLASSLLAACGGGGGSTGGLLPQPGPSNPPKTTYALSIKWFGNGLGSKTAALRHHYSLMPQDASSSGISGPVLLTAQTSYLGPVASGDGAVTFISASPNPSPMPSPTWSVTSSNVQIQAEPSLAGSAQLHATDSSASAGTLTANVPSPVATAASAQVYVYTHLSLECHHVAPSPSDNGPSGYAIQNGKLIEETDPAASDIYIDGPNCYGPFNNPTETDATIHFPHGGTTISAYTAINTITASAFASTTTSVVLNYTASSPPPYAIVFQDANGDKAKLVLEVVGNDYPNPTNPSTTAEGALDGPFCVFGSCVDGT